MQFSPIELWMTIGPLAKAVVVLLAAMSLVSLATAAEKWLALQRALRESRKFLSRWREQVGSRGVVAAVDAARDYAHSPVAQVISVGTAVLQTGLPSEARREAYDRTVRRSVLAASSAMRRGLSILATVGSTAPFIGLVGTVVGIVNAFQQLATSGQGGVGQVSAGIAEALVTTAFGIGVAIPAVWLFNHLTQSIARLIVETECAAEELAIAALGERSRTEATGPPISVKP